MNPDHITELSLILNGEPFRIRSRLGTFIEKLKKEGTPGNRTSQQNRALHKFCELMATELNAAGYSVKQVLEKKSVDVDWSGALVKEALWRPVQEAITGKHSTKELTKQEIDPIYETLNRHLGTHFGIHVPWPSFEVPYDKAPLKGDN